MRARKTILTDVVEVKALVPELDLYLWPSCRELGSGSRM
jgi:hypothetical protein